MTTTGQNNTTAWIRYGNMAGQSLLRGKGKFYEEKEMGQIVTKASILHNG